MVDFLFILVSFIVWSLLYFIVENVPKLNSLILKISKSIELHGFVNAKLKMPNAILIFVISRNNDAKIHSRQIVFTHETYFKINYISRSKTNWLLRRSIIIRHAANNGRLLTQSNYWVYLITLKSGSSPPVKVYSLTRFMCSDSH